MNFTTTFGWMTTERCSEMIKQTVALTRNEIINILIFYIIASGITYFAKYIPKYETRIIQYSILSMLLVSIFLSIFYIYT